MTTSTILKKNEVVKKNSVDAVIPQGVTQIIFMQIVTQMLILFSVVEFLKFTLIRT